MRFFLAKKSPLKQRKVYPIQVSLPIERKNFLFTSPNPCSIHTERLGFYLMCKCKHIPRVMALHPEQHNSDELHKAFIGFIS